MFLRCVTTLAKSRAINPHLACATAREAGVSYRMNIVTTNRSNRLCVGAIVLAVLALGCQERLGQPRSRTPLPRLLVCSTVGNPPALVVTVRDENGRPAARGATLDTRDERGHVNRVTGLDVSTIRIHSGPFGLRYRVRKRGFDAPPDGEVFVRMVGCDIMPESVTVTLRRRADAAELHPGR